MPSLRRALRFFHSPGNVLIALVAVGSLVWAGANAGAGRADLAAAAKNNSCELTTGNGKVKEKPGTCPIDIVLGNVLTTGADVNNISPGGSASRPVDILNDGNNALESITFSSTPTASNTLSSALKLTLRRCSVAWTL